MLQAAKWKLKVINSFAVGIDKVAVPMQKEVTGWQKHSVAEGSIHKFYDGLPENLNTIKTVVKKILTAFGSTYICENAFWVMNFTKK